MINFILNCAISTPFEWKETKEIRNKKYDPEKTVLIGLTYVELGSDSELNNKFWKHVFLIKDNAKENSGLIGVSIRRKLFKNIGWTMTIWEDEESLEKFLQGERHSIAVETGYDALKYTSFLRIQRKIKDIPIKWDEIENLILKDPNTRSREY